MHPEFATLPWSMGREGGGFLARGILSKKMDKAPEPKKPRTAPFPLRGTGSRVGKEGSKAGRVRSAPESALARCRDVLMSKLQT